MNTNNIVYIHPSPAYQKPSAVDTACQIALTVTEAVVTVTIGLGTLGCFLLFLTMYY